MTAWLWTSTLYGQWLPGDSRGSVTNVRDRRPSDSPANVRIEHSRLGEAYEDAIPGLERFAHLSLKGEPVSLDLPMAEQLLEQFFETANHRGWTLEAVSIMFNHAHLALQR